MSGRDRPRQAVIVAGGRGSRLGPLTENRPKAMLPIGGRPFLEWLIDVVREQGFERVLLLLGYRAADIESHFRDGSDLGVRIDYVVTDVEDETGRRVAAALDRIDDRFLFMYCDNLWPMPFDEMWHSYTTHEAPAMVTVYRNDDDFTRDNVAVADDGFVATYDPTRTGPGLGGVEIGYAILERPLLSHIGDRNEPLQSILYPTLAREHRLLAFQTSHRYYSIGKPERLAITEAFVTGSPAVVLDRDGVLNAKAPRAHYVTHWSEFRWLPGALEALRLLTDGGYRVVIVSNQAGVARGAMTADDLHALHARMLQEIDAAGGCVEAIYVCPHDWDEGCSCRKPKPGMLFQAQRELHLDLSRTPFIGDDERDGIAAAAAGMPFMLVDERTSLLDHVESLTTLGAVA